jgi:lipid A disaccharide synthetase
LKYVTPLTVLLPMGKRNFSNFGHPGTWVGLLTLVIPASQNPQKATSKFSRSVVLFTVIKRKTKTK